jgi:acyl dehydratase
MNGPIPVDLRYEDVVVGAEYESESHTMTSEDIAAFAAVTRDRHPLHLDPAHARAFGFPGVIAHGLLGLCLIEGLKSEMRLYENTSIASLGWDKVRFRLPVLVGTELRARVKFIDKRPSRDASRGVVTEAVALVDEGGRVFIEAEHTTLLVTRAVESRRAGRGEFS